MNESTEKTKASALGTLNALVVDDEKIIRDACKRILVKEGWQVTTASNGNRGLDQIRRKSFLVLLLDLKMPGISGMKVLKTVRETRPRVLVIVITGYATIENAVDAMKNGAYDFIPKPFTPDQLRIVMRRGLEKLTLEHEAELLRREQARSLQDIANEKSQTITIINHMADGVLVTDRSGRIVLHNPAVVRMFGKKDRSPPGISLLEWTGSRELSRMVETVLATGPPTGNGLSRELTRGSPPGKQYVGHCAPVCGDQGEIIGSVTIFNDVTVFKQLDQLKSDFVDMVSHELRSPLGSIRQQLSVLASGIDGEINREQLHTLQRAQSRLDGLIGMIRNLLDLSRIETGQMAQLREHVELPGIVRDATMLMAAEAEQKDLTFQITMAPDLFAIRADRQSMEAVVNNLVSNAVKYNRKHGRIVIEAHNKKDRVELRVADTGVGIPRACLPRIFDKFYRIRTRETRTVIGSGIGLPVVKAIVEACSGSISVKSTPGKGTRFTVLLPRCG